MVHSEPSSQGSLYHYITRGQEGEKVANDYIFVIRMWQEKNAPPGEAAPWRVLVEDPRSGEHWGFGDLPPLLEFLKHIAVAQTANEGTSHTPVGFT